MGEESLLNTEEPAAAPPPEGDTGSTPPAPGTELEDGTVVGEGHLSAGEKEEIEGAAERPEWCPEKFWDAKTKEANMEGIAKARAELEKELHKKNALLKERGDVPEAYEDVMPEGLEVSDAVLDKMRELGLTNEQAKGMLATAAEALLPELNQKHTELELRELKSDWGLKTDADFEARLDEVGNWAKLNLPEEALLTMASTAKGVQAIEAMMRVAAKSQQTGGGEGQPSGKLITPQDIDKRVESALYREDSAAGRAFVKETMDMADQMHKQNGSA